LFSVPIVPYTQAQHVTPGGGFDYVTVDSVRRRVYAAHPGGGGLLIADAASGAVLGIVPVGPMAGVAVDEATGHVFTGNGDAQSISEVDPVAKKILRTVKVDGPVDAIAYDAGRRRIYADEDDGTRIFVIDTKTFKQIGTVHLPGHKPEFLQVDPQTGEVYQNIANLGEIAVVDPNSLRVSRVIPTPGITNNHPLQYDAAHQVLLVAGENHVLAVYGRDGKLLHTVNYPGRVDQCSFDSSRGWLACAGGGITLYSFDGTSSPKLLADHAVAPSMHNVAIDAKTGTIWGVWGNRNDPRDAYIQGFRYRP
jgi:DNA-binding beta-propeller fold protein YncE